MNFRRKLLLNPNTVVLLKHILTGFFVLSVVGLILTAIWYGTRLPSLTIDKVQIVGGQTIEHSEVEKRVYKTLEGTYLGLVPRQFAWFYPELEVYESLTEIARIHDVTISRISGQGLVVSFDEYVPHALWCEAVLSDKCLFLDDTGYAFAEAPKLFGGSFLRFVTSGESGSISETLAPEEEYNSLQTLVNLLDENNWYISHVEIDQVGDAFLKVVGGGEFKVTIAQPPMETVNNLLVVLASDDFSHIRAGNFQYIDLRFGNKVFVNEKIVVLETEPTVDEEE